MAAIINLNKYRKQKRDEAELVKEIRDSLDNDAVKRRYGIKTPPPPAKTEEERLANIRASIDRVNKLMAKLNDIVTPKGDKTK